METVFHPTLIEGRHGPVSRQAIESQRARQLQAIQDLRRRLAAPGLRAPGLPVHPELTRP